MDRYSLTGSRPRAIRIFLFYTNRARMNEWFQAFHWFRVDWGSILFKLWNMRFQKYPNSCERGLGKWFEKSIKNKILLYSWGSLPNDCFSRKHSTWEKNKQEKHSNQNKILKDSNMRSQRAERAGAEVCLFALFDCILSKGRDNHRLPLLSKASCHTRYLYCSGNMWFLCFCLSLLNSVRMS